MTQPSPLKPEDTLAQQHSVQLQELIIKTIRENNGFISFEHYMQLCLYTPGLGYYSAGSHKLGKGGDFTTAPEISSLFGATLARHAKVVFEQLSHQQILEFGAGSGKMAADIMLQLKEDQIELEHYFIIETSADLKQRQQSYLQKTLPAVFDKFIWLNALPEHFEGVVFANEVCDAMPVHLLEFDNHNITERGVGEEAGQFIWKNRSIDNPALNDIANRIQQNTEFQHYQTEVNLNAPAWLTALADSMQQGAIFIIDYGYAFAEYYQAARTMGTLMCFYQHKAFDNPLVLQGLQDITAHIDFTSLAETAIHANLDVAAFHSQSDFLLTGGITELAQNLSESSDTAQWLSQSTALKQLLMPGQMGEQFKVLSLTKNLLPLNHLSFNDRRYQL